MLTTHAGMSLIKRTSDLLHCRWGLIPAGRLCKEMACGHGCLCWTLKRKQCKLHENSASTAHRQGQRAAITAIKELSVEKNCALLAFPEFGVKQEVYGKFAGFKGVTRTRSGRYGHVCTAVFDILVVAPSIESCCVVEIQDGGDPGHTGVDREVADHKKELYCGSNNNVIQYAAFGVPKKVESFNSQRFKENVKRQLCAKLGL